MITPEPEKKSEMTAAKPSAWNKLTGIFVKPALASDDKRGETTPVSTVEVSTASRGAMVKPAATVEAGERPVASADESGTAKIKMNEAKAAAPTPPPGKLPLVVKFTNVTKCFGHGTAAQVAIKDVSFAVEDLPDTGEMISIVGPSGCGKSTLLRMIAGLEPHFPQTEGAIEILGRTNNLLPSSERGLVDQKYSLFPHLTVRQNVMFGLDIRGESRSARGDRADIWIKKVGLDGCEDKYPQELSGGMQQRVAIAATLVLGPRILLMDEPFGALDPKIRLKMQELLVDLWNEQQSTVFIVTHSVEEAIYLGDRVFRMGAKPGRLMEILQAPRPEMPPEEMRQKKWFVEMTRDLLNRLEQDKIAAGELSNYSDFVKEHNSTHPKDLRETPHV
jgi:NitT/TauT family transport system ATP-binding protein